MSFEHIEEKWTMLARRADFYGLAEEFGIDPVIARLMVNRGIADSESIRQYLYGDLADLHDAALMADAPLAADLIEKAIEDGVKIAVSSDFDVDGIFSGRLLYEAFKTLGADVILRTPHRVRDGYGMNVRMVEEFAAWGAGMIVTCDNGIAAFEAVDRAKELGMTVVVTDHHEVQYVEEGGERRFVLPSADACVDPKREDCRYPFKGLCGAGVAYKLVSILYGRRGLDMPARFLEYAAIATVCDVMELRDENRIIVKKGLKSLETTDSPGLRAILKACELYGKTLNGYHMGFVVGPCFNAAGRLEGTEKPLELLDTESAERAEELAQAMKSLNDERKEMTEQGTKAAIEMIEELHMDRDDRILVLALKDCHESLAGIIAGRIKERYNRPAIVFTETTECYKGSGRSIEAYHMFEGLNEVRDLLIRFGGHAMAAGMSIAGENIDAFRAALNANCRLTEQDLQPVIRVDVPMPISYISEGLIEQLELLEPMGTGNTKPVFAQKDLRLVRAFVIGKNRNMLKLRVADEQGVQMDAMLFSGMDHFVEAVQRAYGPSAWQSILRGDVGRVRMQLAYYPDINEYNGIRSLQMIVSSFRVY